MLAGGQRADGGVGHRRDGAGHRLDEDDRQRVEVGAAVERRARRLFRRRVPGGAHDGTGRLGPTRLRQRTRQAEVGDPEDAVLVEEQVRRLDVAVDQPADVGVLQCRGDLAADVRGLREREVLAGVEQPPQAPAPQQLEHHERHVVVAPVVDGHHVRVVERRRDLRLRTEAAEEPGVVGEGGVEHLHRDAAAQPDVVGHVDATARARRRSARAGGSGRQARGR